MNPGQEFGKQGKQEVESNQVVQFSCGRILERGKVISHAFLKTESIPWQLSTKLISEYSYKNALSFKEEANASHPPPGKQKAIHFPSDPLSLPSKLMLTQQRGRV